MTKIQNPKHVWNLIDWNLRFIWNLVLEIWYFNDCTYFVQQLPRNPVSDLPDWGRVIDT